MTIKVGDRIPDATFHQMTSDGPGAITTDEIFKGKTVVMFGLPGAFTPTCHANHLPGFIEHNDTIKAKGVDTIAVLATNDLFVMDAWAKATNATGKIEFLSDTSSEFVKEIGLALDVPIFGNTRSQRFVLIAKDGVITHLGIEEGRGETTLTGASAVLAQL